MFKLTFKNNKTAFEVEEISKEKICAEIKIFKKLVGFIVPPNEENSCFRAFIFLERKPTKNNPLPFYIFKLPIKRDTLKEMKEDLKNEGNFLLSDLNVHHFD